MKTITISESLYMELVEYFDNKADVDFDEGGAMPNKEMKILCELSRYDIEQYDGTTTTKD